MSNPYIQYYLEQQQGRGMLVFRGSSWQRGYGQTGYGLSALFSGLARAAMPMLKVGLKTGVKARGRAVVPMLKRNAKSGARTAVPVIKRNSKAMIKSGVKSFAKPPLVVVAICWVMFSAVETLRNQRGHVVERCEHCKDASHTTSAEICSNWMRTISNHQTQR